MYRRKLLLLTGAVFTAGCSQESSNQECGPNEIESVNGGCVNKNGGKEEDSKTPDPERKWISEIYETLDPIVEEIRYIEHEPDDSNIFNGNFKVEYNTAVDNEFELSEEIVKIVESYTELERESDIINTTIHHTAHVMVEGDWIPFATYEVYTSDLQSYLEGYRTWDEVIEKVSDTIKIADIENAED